MFFLNLGYQWNLAALPEVDNVILLPSGSDWERLKTVQRGQFQRVLMDPQLYLAGLDPSKCARTCSRLASCPWFCVPNLPHFNQDKQGLLEWRSSLQEKIEEKWLQQPPEGDEILSACSLSMEFQVQMGCSYIICPSPLISNRETGAALLGDWLDSSIQVFKNKEIGQPLLASVVVDENEIKENAEELSGFLDSLIAQVTARFEFSGVYVVIVQTHTNHPFQMGDKAVAAYLYLASAFNKAFDVVLLNFADIIGYISLGCGASDFATGASLPHRRMTHENYIEEGGGKAFPNFYSHKCGAEFRSEKHLDEIVKNNLVRRIIDHTQYSEPLMKELKRGGSASAIVPWAEAQNNYRTAHKHYIARISQESRKVGKLPLDDRSSLISEWLEDVDVNQVYLKEKLGRELGTQIPASDWSQRLNERL